MCFTQPFQSQQELMTLTNSIKSGCDLIKPCKQCHGPQGLSLLLCPNLKCQRNAITSSCFVKNNKKKKQQLLKHLPLAMALQETIVTIGPLIRYFELIQYPKLQKIHWNRNQTFISQHQLNNVKFPDYMINMF